MDTGKSVKFEAIRQMASASITTSYQLLGSVFVRDALTNFGFNDTDAIIFISTDGIEDELIFPYGMGRSFDWKSDDFYVKAGTQLYIRALVAPTAVANKNFYWENQYG